MEMNFTITRNTLKLLYLLMQYSNNISTTLSLLFAKARSIGVTGVGSTT